MLFDINEKAKIMTREEFLNEIQVEEEAHIVKFFNAAPSQETGEFSCADTCPSNYNLKEFCGLSSDSCKDCWTKAVKSIKFKDDKNK